MLVRRSGFDSKRVVRLAVRLYRRKITHNSFGRWFRMCKSIHTVSGARREVLVF